MNNKYHELSYRILRKIGLTYKNAFRNTSIVIFENKITNITNIQLYRSVTLYLSFSFLITLLGCNQETKAKGPQYGKSPISSQKIIYHFGVHPLHNPTKLMQSYQPLMDYLNSRIKGAEFVLEASKDYSNFEEKYKSRKPEFILANPWQTIQAIKFGYKVIAMAGDPADFKGIIIVRKDSKISKPTDLKGKPVSYPSSTALAGCIMPQYFLHTHGININKDIKNMYVGSQESSIMNVFLKNSVAGATWPPPWRDFQKTHPNESYQLKSIWETESLVNNSVMAREDILQNIKIQVQKYLFELGETQEGKTILENMETAYFKPAANKDYNIVKTYTDRFEKEVRKIEMNK